jgi:hypothetical protein
MMRYIKLENNVPINYTLEQLLVDVPDAVIYRNSEMPHPDLLANYSVYPLVTTPQPTLNEDEIAEEDVPEFKDNEWQQTWKVRAISAAEIQQIIDTRQPIIDNAIVNSFLADNEVQAARYDICKSCTSFTILKTCKECGCIMPLKVKMASASCPLNKW